MYADAGVFLLPALHSEAVPQTAAALEAGEREILSEDRVFDRVPGLVRIWPPPHG